VTATQTASARPIISDTDRQSKTTAASPEQRMVPKKMLMPARNVLNTTSKSDKLNGGAMSPAESDDNIPGDGQANISSLTKEKNYASSSGDSSTQGVPAGAKKLTRTANDVKPLGHRTIQGTNSALRTGTMRKRATLGRAKSVMEKHTKAVKDVYDTNDWDDSDHAPESPDPRNSRIHRIPQLVHAQQVPLYTPATDHQDPCVPKAVGVIHVMDTQE